MSSLQPNSNVPLNLNAFDPLNTASVTTAAKTFAEATASKKRGIPRKTSPQQPKVVVEDQKRLN